MSSKRGVMRNILITAAILAGLGTFMAQNIVRVLNAQSAAESELTANAGAR